MNKKALLAEMERLGMHPGRGLGQNFLLDGNLLDTIVRLAAPTPGEELIEVGPGFGALTGRLLKSGAKLTAIEFDHRLAAYLRERYDGTPGFRLIEADACRVDYGELFPAGTRCRVIANLPYAISSVFIARIAAAPTPPEEMLLMLQLEMAERLAAAPRSKSYGALSVRIQLAYEVKIERRVPPEVFLPPPAVDSAVVRLHRRPEADLPPEKRRRLDSMLKLLFSQRRKQMGKVLGGSYGRGRSLAALAALGIAPETRPDAVPPERFSLLADALEPNGAAGTSAAVEQDPKKGGDGIPGRR